jgi:uncharacterized protein (DUF4415 family)
VSGKHSKKRSQVDRPSPSRGHADLGRLRGMEEEEINATSPPELADLPDGFWEEARVVTPPPKEAISIRIDRDVLEWFRSQGARYQTRMNAVLRSYMTTTNRRGH